MSEEETEEVAEEVPVRATVTPVTRRREARAVTPVRRTAQLVKEVPQKVRAGSVKSKIAAIHRACSNINLGARELQSKSEDQVNENQNAVVALQTRVKSMQNDIKGKTDALQTRVKSMQNDIKGKTDVFQEDIANFSSGVDTLRSDIKEHIRKHENALASMQSSIMGQIKENSAYIKNFYG